ncbi:hypothetical protein G6O69_16980 [Pseudenhygromyxa sp. WMMC2535]|uniref:hypothetical protein n=1 Tax=Pseudenhygromyxa sp. WMMC2535 TaxID=2712867 RepID=UPI0015581E0D|nr:hypothetical protein [Pseudenhygromyxa sp. WMMC2535]NVB39539.1 hypothetical protein [Pseudenhygromyxa sp. WMMC2535]
MSKVLIGACSFAMLLAACEKQGETATPEDASADAAPAEGEGAETAEAQPPHEGEDHEHDFPASVASFHDVMAPLWHAEPGEERIEGTCGAVPDMLTQAKTISGEAAPEAASSEEAWTTSGSGLISAVEGLQTSCEGDRADFDAAFEGVHDAFHQLIEVIGQGH